MRKPLKFIDTIVLQCSMGFRGPSIEPPLPFYRDAIFSNSCTPDRCSFFSAWLQSISYSREIVFRFLSKLKGCDRSDDFPFGYEANRISFGSLKEKNRQYNFFSIRKESENYFSKCTLGWCIVTLVCNCKCVTAIDITIKCTT